MWGCDHTASSPTHQVNSSARAQAVIEAHPALVLRILALRQDVHVPSEVGPLIHSPRASFHSDGVAAT